MLAHANRTGCVRRTRALTLAGTTARLRYRRQTRVTPIAMRGSVTTAATRSVTPMLARRRGSTRAVNAARAVNDAVVVAMARLQAVQVDQLARGLL